MIKSKIVTLLLIFSHLSADSWYDTKLEGWYYFQDNERSDKHDLTKEEAEEILSEEKTTLKQLLSLALLAPSATNVENYLKEQKKWLDQSARFANMWQKVLLTQPLLGDFLTNPTTSFGIQARKDLELQRKKQLLKRLSETRFLLFLFRGQDSFSQKAAEVVQLFASMNGWKVKAVSLDGYPVEPFANYEVDNGISQALGNTVTPSMFVIDPSTAQAAPVGVGLISVSQLEANIESQFQEIPHEP